jgi:hypothetical protein
LEINNLDTSGWDGKRSGARVIPITTELNGSLRSLSSRIKTVLEQKAPELFALIESDTATSISYTDRYLNSPWSLMLLEGFLRVFSKGNKDISITAVESSPNKVGFLMNHDWHDSSDRRDALTNWIKNIVGEKPQVTLVDKPFKVSHGRILKIEWESGKTTQLILDQGMGYWRPRMPYRDQMEFDFYQAIEGQLKDMNDKSDVAIMNNSGSWPTFITIINI